MTARLFDEIFHSIAPTHVCFVFELRWLDVKDMGTPHLTKLK